MRDPGRAEAYLCATQQVLHLGKSCFRGEGASPSSPEGHAGDGPLVGECHSGANLICSKPPRLHRDKYFIFNWKIKALTYKVWPN